MIKTQHIDEIKDPNALIAELNLGYKKYKRSIFSSADRSTLLLLSPISVNIAETYFMNFFEINKILGKYLELWNKNRELSYVRLTTFMSTYHVFNTGILDKFFPYGRIYYDQFFQYVCILSFFEYNQIISLIMSMCRIHSNVFITKEQIVAFISTIDKSNQINLETFFLSHSMSLKDISTKTYSIKAFLGFINDSIVFQSIIYQLRLVIFSDIFPSKYQHIVLNRYNYYTFMPNGEDLATKPVESCSNYLRRIFSREPSPFHYDYAIVNNNNKRKDASMNHIDELLLMLKQNYGYGYRMHSTSRTCYSASLSKGRLSSSKSNHSTQSKLSTLQSRYSICPIKESSNDGNYNSANKIIQRKTMNKKSKSFNIPKCNSSVPPRLMNGGRFRNKSVEEVFIP